jgi:hypothetical protein
VPAPEELPPEAAGLGVVGDPQLTAATQSTSDAQFLTTDFNVFSLSGTQTERGHV